MVWTITNWANADWSDAAILNEFVDAVNERADAVGYGIPPVPVVNIGDDVQAVAFFLQFQQWIESDLTKFVVSHDAEVKRSAGYYDGRTTIDTWPNLTAILGTGWRRYTVHPDQAGGVAYGQMQRGDIIGPWIFEDIQKVLNKLIWTLELCSWRSKEENNQKSSNSGGWFGPDGAAAWRDCKAASEAAWGVLASNDLYPGEMTDGQYYAAGSPPLAYYYAHQTKRYAYGHLTNPTLTLNKEVEFYGFLRAPTYPGFTPVWDAYGDANVAYQNKYQLLQTDPLTPGPVDWYSDQIGNLDGIGTWPTTEGAWANWNLEFRGWQYADYPNAPQAILKWDVAGGFEYCS